ncbi:MAG: hypothetical protein R3Y27_05650 [Clostridia bacterium]
MITIISIIIFLLTAYAALLISTLANPVTDQILLVTFIIVGLNCVLIFLVKMGLNELSLMRKSLEEKSDDKSNEDGGCT